MAEKKVNIILSTQKKGTGIKRVGAELKKLKGQITSFAKSVGLGLGLFSGAGVIAAVASIKTMATEIDKIGKSADALGIKVEEFSKLGFAAELSGSSIEGLGDALEKMLNRVSKAADGTGEAKDAIREIGLEAAELELLAPEEQFKFLADAISNVSTQADKVRLKRAIFGRGNSNIINLINQGSVAIEGMGDKLEGLGGVLSGLEAKEAAAFADSLTTLTASLGALARLATGPVIGKINETLMTFGLDAAPAVEKLDRNIANLQDRLEQFERIAAGEGTNITERFLGATNSDEEFQRIIDQIKARLEELQREKERFNAKDAELEERKASLKAAAEHNALIDGVRKEEVIRLQASLKAKEAVLKSHEEALKTSRDRQKEFAQEIAEAVLDIQSFGEETQDPDRFDVVEKTAAAWNSINAGDTEGARAAIRELIEMFRVYQEAGKASLGDVVLMTDQLEALGQATSDASGETLKRKIEQATAAAKEVKDAIEQKPISLDFAAKDGSGKLVRDQTQDQVWREPPVEVVVGIRLAQAMFGLPDTRATRDGGPGSDVRTESDKRGFRI